MFKFLIIRDIQGKTTVILHPTMVRLLIPNAGDDVRKEECSSLLVELQSLSTPMESNVQNSLKKQHQQLKLSQAFDTAIRLHSIYPKDSPYAH